MSLYDKICRQIHRQLNLQIEALIELEPNDGTPEWRLLKELTLTLEHYSADKVLIGEPGRRRRPRPVFESSPGKCEEGPDHSPSKA